MSFGRVCQLMTLVLCAELCVTSNAHAQNQPSGSRWVIDVGVGIDPTVNGNVNSGAIGTLQGQATAILPQSYGDVYGTGTHLKFGAGYALNDESELRGTFTWQTADANLVRLGDIGSSSLYGQYSDYKSFGLDLGYRRYAPITMKNIRAYGEATLGMAFIDRINVQFAAPQQNVVLNSTDFYDATAAFTWGLNFGALFRVADHVDVNAQFGLRHVSGLSEVDQFVGTGLENINSDTSRLTFPLLVGVRFRF
jgi:Outer membrane protein beta-barrel domain